MHSKSWIGCPIFARSTVLKISIRLYHNVHINMAFPLKEANEFYIDHPAFMACLKIQGAGQRTP
jgi:hypothetical protein